VSQDKSKKSVLIYEREGGAIHLKVQHMTNHEMREVMVGLWARLDAYDQHDFIAELIHYKEAFDDPQHYPDRHLSPVSEAIHRSGRSGS